jgi:hypothetical protein
MKMNTTKPKCKKFQNRSYLVGPFWHKTIKIEGALTLSKMAFEQKLFFTQNETLCSKEAQH